MIIQDMKYRQRRGLAEVTITADDGSITTLDAEIVVRFQLKTSLQVSQEFWDEVTRENEFLLARRKLISYLAVRKKTTLDAQRYLLRAGFSPNATKAAVAHAQRLQYLDDRDYAEAFVRMRTRSGTKGPHIVSRELRAKGISPEEIKSAVSPMTESDSQIEAARRVAAKKYPSIKDDSDLVKAARRLSQHLARRGFDADICEQVTREFFGDPTQF